MSEKVLDIEINHETCEIVAHLDGSQDPAECKEEILELLEEIGVFIDGRWTLSFHSGGDDPNAKQKLGQNLRTKQRDKQTN